MSVACTPCTLFHEATYRLSVTSIVISGTTHVLTGLHGLQGSDEPPKFIHLTYSPPGASNPPKLAFVGKGVTFDTGGYNIKAGPGSLIEKMKFDMGGSAAVFGAARAIAELAPQNVEIHFISAACENMINGKAFRPGDVLVSASGKTVEVRCVLPFWIRAIYDRRAVRE